MPKRTAILAGAQGKRYRYSCLSERLSQYMVLSKGLTTGPSLKERQSGFQVPSVGRHKNTYRKRRTRQNKLMNGRVA
jgi:hypothetical protein